MTEIVELLTAIVQRLDLLLAMQAERDERDAEIDRDNAGEQTKYLCMGGEIVEVV